LTFEVEVKAVTMRVTDSDSVCWWLLANKDTSFHNTVPFCGNC